MTTSVCLQCGVELVHNPAAGQEDADQDERGRPMIWCSEACAYRWVTDPGHLERIKGWTSVNHLPPTKIGGEGGGGEVARSMRQRSVGSKRRSLSGPASS